MKQRIHCLLSINISVHTVRQEDRKPMNYIVFDLEWNQNPDGRKHPDSRLPFEIIEIGAVKLNEKERSSTPSSA